MTDPTQNPDNDGAATIPPGRIDIHSHLLPGIDDGCRDFAEVTASIRMLKQAGYVGSICTPHIWPDLFPDNTPANIATWTQMLGDQLRQARIDYALWPGGELRLFDGVIDRVQQIGVPTLAGSRFVLMDFWEPKWPRWVARTMDWFIEQGYQPILAHPERIVQQRKLLKRIDELVERGVLLQGNFRCMTGEEGSAADQLVRTLLDKGRYTFLALDTHRPQDLDSRLDGLALVEREYGGKFVDQGTIERPRQMILGQAARSNRP